MDWIAESLHAEVQGPWQSTRDFEVFTSARMQAIGAMLMMCGLPFSLRCRPSADVNSEMTATGTCSSCDRIALSVPHQLLAPPCALCRSGFSGQALLVCLLIVPHCMLLVQRSAEACVLQLPDC